VDRPRIRSGFFAAAFAGCGAAAEWSASIGLGGKAKFPQRERDTWLGYYYTRLQETRLSGAVGIRDYSNGGEAYYSVAMTPAVDLTFDGQPVDSPFAGVKRAVILGLRFDVRF
jgi:hypothetical protein